MAVAVYLALLSLILLYIERRGLGDPLDLSNFSISSTFEYGMAI